MNRIVQFLESDDGTTAVEYAVLLAGILAVLIAGITAVGGESGNFWSTNQSQLDAALGAAVSGS